MSIESFFVMLLVVILGWYISFSASRLDRLHHRVETSWATLDALLQQRAALAHEIVAESNLDPATAYLISASASAARFANLEANQRKSLRSRRSWKNQNGKWG